MKSLLKKASALLFAATLITACHVNGFNKVTGNKNVTTKERTISKPFTKVDVSQGITVYITMSENVSLTVEADENLHEHIKTEVHNGVLKIFTEETIWKAKARNIYIKAPNINAMKASSGSEIISDNTLISSNFDIKASSGASMNLILNSESVFSSTSSGSSIELKGKSFSHTSKASSGSVIDANALNSKEVIVHASSGASIDVNATENLIAKASSGGHIEYSGNPKKIERKSSSGGAISAQ